jgi:hypothetical protein
VIIGLESPLRIDAMRWLMAQRLTDVKSAVFKSKGLDWNGE